MSKSDWPYSTIVPPATCTLRTTPSSPARTGIVDFQTSSVHTTSSARTRPPCSDVGRAIGLGDRTVHTWRTFADAVARRSAALRASLGVAPGDRVMLFAPNRPEYLEILFSIWHAGAVAVPVNGKLHPREAAELMDRSGARVCFAAGGLGGWPGVAVFGFCGGRRPPPCPGGPPAPPARPP